MKENRQFSFLKLKVYDKALRFAGLIYELASKEKEKFRLWEWIEKEAIQLPQAIACASSFQEDSSKALALKEGRGICYRLVPLFEMGQRKGLINEINAEIIFEELESFIRMLSNFISIIEKDLAKQNKGLDKRGVIV